MKVIIALFILFVGFIFWAVPTQDDCIVYQNDPLVLRVTSQATVKIVEQTYVITDNGRTYNFPIIGTTTRQSGCSGRI